MKILIFNVEESEPEHLAACIERAKRWGRGDAEIHVRPREQNGWLEYLLKLPYAGTPAQSIWVGAIQRKPGDTVEFHS